MAPGGSSKGQRPLGLHETWNAIGCIRTQIDAKYDFRSTHGSFTNTYGRSCRVLVLLYVPEYTFQTKRPKMSCSSANSPTLPKRKNWGSKLLSPPHVPVGTFLYIQIHFCCGLNRRLIFIFLSSIGEPVEDTCGCLSIYAMRRESCVPLRPPTRLTVQSIGWWIQRVMRCVL